MSIKHNIANKILNITTNITIYLFSEIKTVTDGDEFEKKIAPFSYQCRLRFTFSNISPGMSANLS